MLWPTHIKQVRAYRRTPNALDRVTILQRLNTSRAILAEIDECVRECLENGSIEVKPSPFDDKIVPIVYAFNKHECVALLIYHAVATIVFNRMVTILDTSPALQKKLDAQNRVLGQRIWMSLDHAKRELPLGGQVVSLGLTLSISCAPPELHSWIVDGVNALQVMEAAPNITKDRLMLFSDYSCGLRD